MRLSKSTKVETAHIPSKTNSQPEQRLRIKDLLGFLKFTKDYKKEYTFMIIFLSLQMLSYQLLAYSLKYLINDLIPKKRIDYIVIYLVAWVGTFLIHSVFTLLAARFRIVIVRSLVANVRSEIIRKMQVLSIKYFDMRGTGATSAKLLMDVEKMQGFFEWVLVSFMQAIFGILFIVPILSTINVTLTLITVLYVPTIPILQQLFRKQLTKRSYELRNTSAQLSEKLIDFISGVKQIRLFATEDEQSARILTEVRNMRNVEIRYSFAMRVLAMAIQFFGDYMQVLLWGVAGIIMITSTDLSLGAVVAYIALVGQMVGNFHVLFSSFDQVVAASPSVTAISEILDSEEIENQSPQIKKFTLQGEIKVQNVNFSYENRGGQHQLHDINMAIQKGEKIGLVGESGSGKSTFVHVLLGLYPIKSGKILFDNQDLSSLSLKMLRSQIAIMNQETFLFNTSIKENIRFARLNASDDEIIDACKKAEIYDFISNLPDGFNTNTGERGVMLSGGQRQRIGLARVFLRNPQIIILDEPTSALDIFTEQKLLESLYKNVEGKTLIVIAHRLSTIKDVDRVFVFKDGSIVEGGNIDDLQKQSGIFSEMVKASNSQYV